MALARTHEITLPTLADLGQDDHRQQTLHGDDVEVSDVKITNLALLFHELATNAAKYGALSVGDGSVDITLTISPDTLELV